MILQVKENLKSLQKVPNSLKPHSPKILVVDDEANIRQILSTRLTMIGYDVVTAGDGFEALDICSRQLPDLVILDVMLPQLDGFAVCQVLRKQSDVPIIMLTGMTDVKERITGLELGADDCMVKPFSLKELESRIRCILRRVNPSTKSTVEKGVIQSGSLLIDTNKRQVFQGRERIRLTDMEFNLLLMLVTRAGEAISRREILLSVWGYTPEYWDDMRVVDVYVSRLRSKLQRNLNQPELIVTVRGKGYTFQPCT